MLKMLRSFTLLGTILAALALAGIASAEGGQPADLPVGGVPVGDTIVYDGGQLVTGVGPLAFGDCTGGRFCLWDLEGYAGEWVYKTSTGWYNLSSFDNRRSRLGTTPAGKARSQPGTTEAARSRRTTPVAISTASGASSTTRCRRTASAPARTDISEGGVSRPPNPRASQAPPSPAGLGHPREFVGPIRRGSTGRSCSKHTTRAIGVTRVVEGRAGHRARSAAGTCGRVRTGLAPDATGIPDHAERLADAEQLAPLIIARKCPATARSTARPCAGGRPARSSRVRERAEAKP